MLLYIVFKQVVGHLLSDPLFVTHLDGVHYGVFLIAGEGRDYFENFF